MWSVLRTAAARGLLISPAAESKIFGPAARRIATAAAARAPPRPRASLCVPLFDCAEGQQTRGFASAVTKKPAAKAKAKATAKKTTAKQKVAAKKTTVKKKVAAKKPLAKKKTVKAAAAAKKTKKPRKELTPEEKKKLQVRDLKKVALLKEPARLPEHPWILYVSENTKGIKVDVEDGRSNLGQLMKSLSPSFKSLPANELQRLRDIVAKNSEINAAAYKAWVETHPVQDVAAANRARLHLKRLGGTTRRTIHDSRLPKRPRTAFALYTKSRWSSGDFQGVSIVEASKTIAAEWKTLSPSERQPFEDNAKTEFGLYEVEAESVLGRPISKSPSPASP